MPSYFPPETVFIKLLKSKTDEDGDVVVIYPRSKVKPWLRRLFAPAVRNVQLDKTGSFVWNLCDGKTSFSQICKELELKFPNEKDIIHRSELFLNFLIRKDMLQALVPAEPAENND